MRRFASGLFALALFLCMSISASAAASGVVYHANAKKYIFTPGSQYSPTDLFPNFKDVMPGDTLTQTITVRNDKHNNVKIRVYLRSLGADDAQSREFLSQLNLRVSKSSDTVYFNASPDEKAQLKDWTYLGLLYSSGKADLEVELTVPKSLDNTFAQRVGVLTWEFMVEELPISSDDPPPKTSDTFPLTALTAALVISASGLLILLIFRKRQRDS